MSEVYCENCGNIVQPKDRFCRKCGSSLGSKIVTAEPTHSVQPKRGGCLTAFLIVNLIIQPILGIFYFTAALSGSQSFPNMPAWSIPILGITGIVNFVCAIAMWRWKKWGLYGFAISAGIIFFINAIYIAIPSALLGLAGVATLAFLLRQVWNQME